jgi:hypothetical protein
MGTLGMYGRLLIYFLQSHWEIALN